MGSAFVVIVILVAGAIALKYFLPGPHVMRRSADVGLHPVDEVTIISPDVPKPAPMPVSESDRLEWFWEIIEFSVPEDGSQETQIDALRCQLVQLRADEILEFGSIFSRIMATTYSWDLWGAAYVIMGGCSDDGFEYFRVWMISRGREFFDAAVSDPDSMAELIPTDLEEYPDFELLAYVPGEVWEAKTGEEEMPSRPEMIYMYNPAGEPFSEDEEALAARYPKLWERFGDEPIG